MSDRQSSYTIRLKVEGDGSVTAQLVKVGDTGERQFQRLTAAGNKADLVMQGITKTITTRLIPAFSAAAAARSIIDNITLFEKIDARIQRLTESSEDYAKVQQFISQKSNDLSIDIVTFADNYARLLTLQQSGVLTELQTKALAEGFANAGAALGATGAEIDRAMIGLSQALTAGVVHMQDFKQVTEPLPGLMQQLDKAAGLSAGGFRKLIEDGKVTSQFFATTLINALQSYQGAAAAMADTVSGSWVRLKNQWIELSRTLQTPIKDALVPILNTLSDALNLITKLEDKRDGLVKSSQDQPILDITKQLDDLRAVTKEIDEQKKILDSLSSDPDRLARFGDAPKQALERLVPLAEKLESKFGPEQLQLIEQKIKEIQTEIDKAPPPQNGRSFTEALEKELSYLEKIRDQVKAITGEIVQAPAVPAAPTGVDEFIQNLKDQLSILQQEGKARAELRAQIQLENVARREGITLTPQQIAQVKELVSKTYDLDNAQKQANQTKADAVATIKDEISDPAKLLHSERKRLVWRSEWSIAFLCARRRKVGGDS